MERTRIAKVSYSSDQTVSSQYILTYFRVPQVDNVTLARRGEQVDGTLHLTPHHLIFSHIPPPAPSDQSQEQAVKPKELWITYPIISFCVFRPSPSASRQPSSIRLRCRDFTFACFYFNSETKAREAYDSIRSWTCKRGRIEKLYAFAYKPPPPELEVDGWSIYNAQKEWDRLGVGKEGSNYGWRVSYINADYSVCTIPSLNGLCLEANWCSFRRPILLCFLFRKGYQTIP